MKYRAVEDGKGWQVNLVDEADQDAGYLGFATTIEEAAKMVGDHVKERKVERRVVEYDDDGKLIKGDK